MKDSGNITYTLIHPLKVNDNETITEVVLRRPKGADLKAMDKAKGNNGKMLKLLSNLAVNEIAPRHFEEMDGEDVMAMQDIASDFLGLAD